MRQPCKLRNNRATHGAKPSELTEMEAGEVWFADLGIAEKSRPVLILAVPRTEDARALVIVAPLTSQIRGMRGEVDPWNPAGCTKLPALEQFRSGSL